MYFAVLASPVGAGVGDRTFDCRSRCKVARGGGSAPYCSFLWRDALQRVISSFSTPTSMVGAATIQSRHAKVITTAPARIAVLLGVRCTPNMIVSRPTAERAAAMMLTASSPLSSSGLCVGARPSCGRLLSRVYSRKCENIDSNGAIWHHVGAPLTYPQGPVQLRDGGAGPVGPRTSRGN